MKTKGNSRTSKIKSKIMPRGRIVDAAVKGLARLSDGFLQIGHRQFLPDEDALYADWNAVGDDIRIALRRSGFTRR